MVGAFLLRRFGLAGNLCAMEIKDIKAAHLVGIGGINMAAVAKLLLARGVRVTGSDMAENEQVGILRNKGIGIAVGHDAKNVPEKCDVLIHTSAAPETNPERIEARQRGIPEMTNFRFLGEWTADQKVVLVTGTHGKSTTTAMLGAMLQAAGLDPTVILGSKLPDWPDGNLRLGKSDLWVIEGDEYARHFLEFKPYAALINNIELDHVDVYPSLDDYRNAFAEMLGKIQDGGILAANFGDENVARLLREHEAGLIGRGVRVVKFASTSDEADAWTVEFDDADGGLGLRLKKGNEEFRFVLRVHGSHNAMNAAGAALLALELGAAEDAVCQALADFNGIWRRFERLGELDGVFWYTDYAHHPTAVAATLAAAREAYPSKRIVACFQPHHRNRTRNLFAEFIPSADAADVLVLCEIYDVKGRDATEDAEMSSRLLVDAIRKHDAERGVSRLVEYAPDPAAAVVKTKELSQSGDAVIIMGAGDIDDAVRKMFL